MMMEETKNFLCRPLMNKCKHVATAFFKMMLLFFFSYIRGYVDSDLYHLMLHIIEKVSFLSFESLKKIICNILILVTNKYYSIKSDSVVTEKGF